ncbi:hypothetical protein [Auritidibacter ignavus]|uniref:hypothetical protein n=1 Tax=Auritidibacter ignavus TaxID=678932 RepID=UPI00244BA095|nr:hypothetical protein [Auritidibacter ignavus]WGH86035.1 hypothetical protein QDX24_10780 [Auritidibacter ignavus]WGH88321.1 hypothetical protein QDX22_10780 [Auritidibacter ignavus]
MGRDQVARLVRLAGISGVTRGRKPPTTIPAKVPDHRPDLVNRDFKVNAPHQLWVAEIERHEVLSNLAVVKGHRFASVAAGV